MYVINRQFQCYRMSTFRECREHATRIAIFSSPSSLAATTSVSTKSSSRHRTRKLERMKRAIFKSVCKWEIMFSSRSSWKVKCTSSFVKCCSSSRVWACLKVFEIFESIRSSTHMSINYANQRVAWRIWFC